MFGTPVGPATISWIRGSSSVSGLTGFFLFLNNTATLFDGADASEPARTVVFNQVRVVLHRKHELNIINPGDDPATLQVSLISGGATLATNSLGLPARGAARLDAAGFFEISEASADTYIVVSSNTSVSGLAFVRTANGDLFGLNALAITEKLTDLYFPQMVVLGPAKTDLVVVNYSDQAVILTVSVFRPDGSLYGPTDLLNNPATRSLPPQGMLAEDVETMFGFSGDVTLDGWIHVESSSPAINGFVSYGIPTTGAVAAVTTAGEGKKRTIFSHISTTGGFFTGVAALNSGCASSAQMGRFGFQAKRQLEPMLIGRV